LAHHFDAQVHKIQAAVLRKKGGPMTIESPELEGPRDEEVLVRIVASGICHTESFNRAFDRFLAKWDSIIPNLLTFQT
jgi:threonine dehydrogenase-like Zn-dependent dehydrogenase